MWSFRINILNVKSVKKIIAFGNLFINNKYRTFIRNKIYWFDWDYYCFCSLLITIKNLIVNWLFCDDISVKNLE